MHRIQEKTDNHTSKTVFLVDDDDSIQKYIKRLLGSVSLECESYARAEDFLENLDSDRAGCLLLDVRIPGMGGLELQKTLRKRGVRLPVIVLTGYVDMAVAVRAVKMGALDVLEKPFNGQKLLDRVQEALRLNAEWLEHKELQKQFQEQLRALTPREQEVMEQIISGKSSKTIASDLGISRKTFEIHRARIMDKMKADTPVELAKKAWMGKRYEAECHCTSLE
jgi:two-component system response regulator FixJ